MPRGVPLSPEQTRAIARTYAVTGSSAEAGRAAGVSAGVARDAMRRTGALDRAALDAPGIDRGLREGHRGMRRAVACAMRLLDHREHIEPRELALVAQVVSAAVARTLDIHAAHDRLAKVEAEARLARARIEGKASSSRVAAIDPAAAEELFARAFSTRATTKREAP